MFVAVEGRERIRECEPDVPRVVVEIVQGARERPCQGVRRIERQSGQQFGTSQPDIVLCQFGLFLQQQHGRVVAVGLCDVVFARFGGVGLLQQGRVGVEQQVFVHSQQDIQLSGYEADVVFRLLQRQPVVGELHFAAQHVVVGINVSFQHQVLFVEAE